MPQATLASIPQNLSVQEAAAAIVQLINTTPRTPWVSEIEAVIARVGAPALAMSPAHAEFCQEWRRLIEEHMREFQNPDETGKTHAEIAAEEDRMSASTRAIDALGNRIVAVPARTWDDVMLYAQACSWQYWAGVDPEGPDARAI